MVAPAMLTVKECAERLGVSQSLVYAALQAGQLPGFRFGRPGKRGTWRVAAYDLDQWVQTLKAGTAPPPPAPAPRKAKPGRPGLRHLTL